MKNVPDSEMRARYRKMRVNGKQVSVHRHIAEQMIGRKLFANEVVHHINGNKLDNRPENLMVMDAGEHSRLENIGKSLTEEHKNKLSVALNGRPSPMKGRSQTPEAKRQISETVKKARAARFWSTKPKHHE